MVRRGALLLAATLAATATVGACGPDGKTRQETIERFIPTGRTSLDLEFAFPAGGSFDTTCAGAGSYLLSIDTNGAGVFQYQLLFNSTRTALHGCGTPAEECPAGTGLGAELPAISRVMVEGLSVTPAFYLTSSGAIDVVCRGIADEVIVPGSITFEALAPTPTPAALPSYADTGRFTINVKMLEVGASNPLPIGTGIVPTQRRFGAAASLSVPEHNIGIGAPAGHVAIAGGIESGGTLPDQIWEFDPQTLSFSQSVSTLTMDGVGRVGLSATTYVGPGGEPTILFAGGSSAAALQTADAVSWQPTTSFHHTMGVARSFHGAAYLQRAIPVIVLLGGANFEDATQSLGGGELSDYAYFAPPSAALPPPCQIVPTANGTFCDPSNNLLTAARGFGATIPFVEGGAPKVWFAGGAAGGSSRVEAEPFLGASTGAFDSSNALAAAAAGGAGAVLTSSGQPGINNYPLLFGGLEAPGAAIGRNLAFIRTGAGSATQLSNNMKIPRGALSAVTLRDRTVLLVGGRDDGALVDGIAPLEVFVPNASPIDLGEFRFVATPGGACDTTGVSTTGCPALVTPRWGQTATRLEETWTWLDGAVLIAGGGQPSTSGAELFVPAYRCQDDSPVTPLTGEAAEVLSNPTLPALCDLGRIAVSITNPTAP